MPQPIKDKAFKREQKRINRIMERWRDPLRLFEWEIVRLYSRGPFPVDGEWGQRPAAAMASVDWQYRRATLTFDTEATRDYDDAKLERIVVHELVHVIVNEMRCWKDADDGMAHEERVVETLAWILVGIGVEKSD